MKVLITGGLGFIGQNFISLYKNKHQFVILGRPQISKSDIDFEYYSTDYSKSSLNSILKNCDAVVHLASARPGNNANSFDDYINNVYRTNNIFDACAELGIANIVYSSTILIYGDKNSNNILETEIPLPDNFYGLSKYFCELIAEQFIRNYDLNIKILRIGQVFGNGDKPTRLINHFINLALNKEKLKIYGDGSLKRNYIYVKDVCEAIDLSLRNVKISGTYNICSNEIYSIIEIAKIINRKFDYDKNIEFIKSNLEFKNAKFYNIEKALKELNWKPKWNLESAIDDMIKYRNNCNDPI